MADNDSACSNLRVYNKQKKQMASSDIYDKTKDQMYSTGTGFSTPTENV